MKIIKKLIKISLLSVFGAGLVVAGVLVISLLPEAKASEDTKFDYIEMNTKKYEDETLSVNEVASEDVKIDEVEVPSVETKVIASDEEQIVTIVEEQKVTEEVVVVEPATAKEEVKVQDVVVAEPVAGVALSDEQGVIVAKTNAQKYSSMAQEVYQLINNYRVENGLQSLAYDNKLELVAMQRSAENAWVEYFKVTVIDGKSHHLRPNGLKASSIFSVYGLTGLYAENMGRYQATPYEIVLGEYGWKNSASHNALMLSTSYTKIGVGIAQDSEGYYYWTAVFAN